MTLAHSDAITVHLCIIPSYFLSAEVDKVGQVTQCVTQCFWYGHVKAYYIAQ